MIKLSDYIQQAENQLYALKDCVVKLDLINYDINDTIVISEEENKIWVNSLISTVEFDDLEFDFILDYALTFNIVEIKKIDKEYIELYYKADNLILEIPVQQEDFKQHTNYVKRLLNGKELFKDSDHLFLRFYNAYSDITNIDLVHMEILISNVLRDRKDLSIPARLGSPFDPVCINIKDIIFKSGVLQGIAFENIGKAINNALIDEKDSPPTILEKVLMNQITEVEKGKFK
jgi:hypothetical protein